mmetsp:Transcript_14740/g.20489  ORF Transcript_14740/g.20489 Transcript_14740/m.20489 type:complete len:250 (+) Transcript_14740:215-964(+)
MTLKTMKSESDYKMDRTLAMSSNINKSSITKNSSKKKRYKSVSFGGSCVRLFTAGSIIGVKENLTSVSHNRPEQVQEANKIIDSIRDDPVVLNHDSTSVLKTLQSIRKDRKSEISRWIIFPFLKPRNFTLYSRDDNASNSVDQGKVSIIKRAKNPVTRWTWTESLIRDAVEGKLELDLITIHRRGYALAELFLRSTRNLDHDRYLNSIVQRLYSSLSAESLKKTNSEWTEHHFFRKGIYVTQKRKIPID